MISGCAWSQDSDVTIFRFHMMGYGFLAKYWILKEFLNKDQTVSQYACILHESPFKCLTEMQGNKVSFQFFKWLFIIYAK